MSFLPSVSSWPSSALYDNDCFCCVYLYFFVFLLFSPNLHLTPVVWRCVSVRRNPPAAITSFPPSPTPIHAQRCRTACLYLWLASCLRSACRPHAPALLNPPACSGQPVIPDHLAFLDHAPGLIDIPFTGHCSSNIETIKGLSSPHFPLDVAREFVMYALAEAVKTNQVHNRDPIGGSNENLFV